MQVRKSLHSSERTLRAILMRVLREKRRAVERASVFSKTWVVLNSVSRNRKSKVPSEEVSEEMRYVFLDNGWKVILTIMWQKLGWILSLSYCFVESRNCEWWNWIDGSGNIKQSVEAWLLLKAPSKMQEERNDLKMQ